MPATIMVTGATDGIGLETAKLLVAKGHRVLLHGRNAAKLESVKSQLSDSGAGAVIETYLADLSRLADVEVLAKAVAEKHTQLDVLINNAGVYSTPSPLTDDGLDVRFAVNTIAPYVLAKRLMPLFGPAGRIVNLSSAAQAPVDLKALTAKPQLSDGMAYAQSKLALTMWSRSLSLSLGEDGPAVIAVNPGSMLGSKMVKEAYGVAGGDIQIGANILVSAALDEQFATASGQYFDNDIGQFAPPHPDALDAEKSDALVAAIETRLA